MKLIKEKEMPLLSRKRLTLEMEHAGSSTPKKEGVRELVAKLAKTKPELVTIRHIYTRFGIGKSKVIAHVYQNEDELKILEKKKEKKEKKKK